MAERKIRTPARQHLAAGIALMLSGGLISCANSGSDLQEDLRRYNALQLSEDASLYPPDNGEAQAFADYDFTCRRQADHVPVEAPAAKEAFERFVVEVRSRSDPGEDDRQRRLELLQAAVAAGSWRARFVDANWVIGLDPSTPEARGQFDQLRAMADEGNPAALHSMLRWTNGMYEDVPQRIRLLKAAIEGGNPQALGTLGFDLGTRTRNLRPLGVKMLECAAAQGDSDAHEGLGRIAWLEGRWVDAYREWQAGANLGCTDCLVHMEDIGLAKADFRPSDGTYGQDTQITALRKHYESQFLHEITQLVELRETAPQNLWIQWSDEQIVAVIAARIRAYGVP